MLTALLLAAALQAPPAPSVDGTPDEKAAALATLDLVYGCMLTLTAYDTAEAYAGAAAKMDSGVPAPAPPWAAAVRMDGVGGHGCRVRYVGPMADRVWQADAKFLHSLATPAADARNGCAFPSDGPTLLAGRCVSTGGDAVTRTHHADIRLERSGAGASAAVTASVLDPRP